MFRPLLLATLLAASFGAVAQPAAASAPPKPSSPAKKALVAKVLQLQQPGIEAMSRQLVEQPALMLLQQAGQAMQQRVPADRREAVGKDLQADARKYADETTPIVRKRAVELAPSTIGPLLEQTFTEDELKQIIATLESPVQKRFLQLGPQMQQGLVEKVVADTRPQVEVKVKALEQTFLKRFDSAASAPAAAAPVAPSASGARP